MKRIRLSASALDCAVDHERSMVAAIFGEHLPAWSLADVLSLESAVIRYISEAGKVDKAAAALFVPYAAWVAFAALLTEEIVRRNPDSANMFPRPA